MAVPRDPGLRFTNLFARLTSDAEGQQGRAAPEEMERHLCILVTDAQTVTRLAG
jgi:hypothetical protein